MKHWLVKKIHCTYADRKHQRSLHKKLLNWFIGHNYLIHGHEMGINYKPIPYLT